MSTAAHQKEVRRVVAALQRYIDERPQHYGGLCYWLQGELFPAEGNEHVYCLVDSAREHGVKFPFGIGYVCKEKGYQPERAALARRLIVLLESGKLTLPWVE